MNCLPLVAIVTPSYNQGRFIRETIESVLMQDYPHIEYMVIDGGSNDETRGILESYGTRLNWLSEADRGQAEAINKGWRRSRGEIVAWLNSDDMYMPGAVSKAVDHLLKNQSLGMVYGEAYRISENGSLIDRYPTESIDARRLAEHCGVCQPAAFIRRAVIEDVGYLDESLQYCIDYDLWIRISRKYPVSYVPDVLAKSRLHGECKTMKQRTASHREACKTVHRHYGFVPPSWLGGYAREVVKARFQAIASPNWVLSLAVVGVAAVAFLRYNFRLPFSELVKWRHGMLKNFNKLWKGL